MLESYVIKVNSLPNHVNSCLYYMYWLFICLYYYLFNLGVIAQQMESKFLLFQQVVSELPLSKQVVSQPIESQYNLREDFVPVCNYSIQGRALNIQTMIILIKKSLIGLRWSCRNKERRLLDRISIKAEICCKQPQILIWTWLLIWLFFVRKES